MGKLADITLKICIIIASKRRFVNATGENPGGKLLQKYEILIFFRKTLAFSFRLCYNKMQNNQFVPFRHTRKGMKIDEGRNSSRLQGHNHHLRLRQRDPHPFHQGRHPC